MAPGIGLRNFDPASILFGLGGGIGAGPSACNHVPLLIPGWAHATTGVSTQVINNVAGNGDIITAMLSGANLGSYMITDGTFAYPIIPIALSLFFSAAGEAATVTARGLDTLGRQVTEVLAKGTTGTAVNGLVLWSRLDSLAITVNGLAANTFTVGVGYRQSTSITGAVPMPIPFIPRATGGVVAGSNLGWTTRAIPRLAPLLLGGGAWPSGNSRYLATNSTGGTGGRHCLVTGGQSVATGGVATTYGNGGTSTGNSTWTATGGVYGGGPSSRVLIHFPNITTPANVTTPPIYVVQVDPNEIKYGGVNA